MASSTTNTPAERYSSPSPSPTSPRNQAPPPFSSPANAPIPPPAIPTITPGGTLVHHGFHPSRRPLDLPPAVPAQRSALAEQIAARPLPAPPSPPRGRSAAETECLLRDMSPGTAVGGDPDEYLIGELVEESVEEGYESGMYVTDLSEKVAVMSGLEEESEESGGWRRFWRIFCCRE